jgi:transcription elongation factor Elf1
MPNTRDSKPLTKFPTCPYCNHIEIVYRGIQFNDRKCPKCGKTYEVETDFDINGYRNFRK